MNAREDLETLVGEWLTVPAVAEMLGTDVGKVRRLVQEGRLVGARVGERPVLRIPAAFLVDGRLAHGASSPSRDADAPEWAVLAAVQGTLTLLHDAQFDDEEAIAWLFTREESLGSTPVEALRAGHKTQVRRLAQAEL